MHTKASAYCGGNFKKTDMKTTMLWCSHTKPTPRTTTSLWKGRLILLKSTSKDDERYLTVQTTEIKELISDFRDVARKALMMLHIAIGRKPIVLIHGRIIHPRAMNKGIYYSLIESEHRHASASMFCTSVFKHLGFI
jgi:hypothetical protein